jgi:hypothetical protein
MISTRLNALLHSSREDGSLPVWGGDWNFVVNKSQDRMTQIFDHTGQAVRRVCPSPHVTDSEAAAGQNAELACMVQHCPELVDAYRHLHPHGTSLTFFTAKTFKDTSVPNSPVIKKTLSASRLDRFYVAQPLLPYVIQCNVPTHATSSDHRVVRLDLLSKHTAEKGPGLKRCRVCYSKHQDLRKKMDDWLTAQFENMPGADQHQAILDWWGAFKSEFKSKIKEVGWEAKNRDADALLAPQELERQYNAAAAEFMQGHGPGAEALARFERAVAMWKLAMVRRAHAQASGRMRSWVQEGERPNPSMSKIMKPSAESTSMSGLSDPHSGAVVSGDKEMAGIMIRYWANISAAPTIDPDAESRVLDALRSKCTKIAEDDARAVGSDTITPGEVRKAMKGMKPNSAPGIDGLPLEAFRLHKQVTSDILARLFTAMGITGQKPTDFHLGAVTFLFKKGTKSDPANYRPITLLNTDYRILTRILAMRLGPVMTKVVGREQSAFMPGRRIGEAVWLLQLLPHLLRLQWREAAVCFMDFKKAYDTVSRPFLFAAMEAMGAGEGMLKWVRMLLGGTHAVAMVNGWQSDPKEFHAGVRQGCPLSPLLYIFVAQALLSWLQANGHGIQVTGQGASNDAATLTAVQYADDCSALLKSLRDLPTFEMHMGTFALATNQYLNKDKTHVMRVGFWDRNAPPPPDNLPFELVQSAVTLGVRISNEPPSQAELEAFWKPHVESAERSLKRICKLGLSMFGRAFAVNGYAISALLYRAEFMGFPMTPVRARGGGMQLSDAFQELHARIASTVDKQSPKKPTYTGFSAERATGRPQEGGTGLLPLVAHTKARLAWWGMQLLTASQREGPHPPWIIVARAVISQAKPGLTPLIMLARKSQIPPSLGSEEYTWGPTARLMLSLQPL